MRPAFRKSVPLLIAAVLLLGACICEGIGVCMTSGQLHQTAAERWAADGELSYVQVSAFFGSQSATTEAALDSIRETVNKKLTEASLKPADKDARLWYDAWSTEQKQVTVRGAKTTECTALATELGGDFFLAHPMRLLGGSYIQPDDLMHDRVVIDHLLAWQAFGSPDVAGMELTIDGTVYQIAGVVAPEQDKTTQTAYGKTPRVYMPFPKSTETEGSFAGSGSLICCYEAVLPNPVRGFGEKLLKEAVGEHAGIRFVTNSGRGSLARRWNHFRHLREMVVVTDSIVYPWWENAARMRDFSAAELMCPEILLLLFPVLCLLAYIWKGYRLLEQFIERKREAHKRRYRTIEKDPYSI
jgi:hypothetical protein